MVDTVYLHLEFPNKDGGWSINLPFLCTKCGVCCILDDFLTAGPLVAKSGVPPEVAATLKSLYDKLADLIEEGEDQYDNYTLHTPCPFLSNKICSIYEIRPEGCRRFPNTLFGMQADHCEALNRFRQQRIALKRGRTAKGSLHFTDTEPHQPSRFTQKQYQTCRAKLRKAGATADELALFELLNP